MAMTAASMMAKIKTYQDAIAVPTGQLNSGTPAYRDALLTALCQGIIDEISLNAEIDTSSGAHSGHISGTGDHTHPAGSLS